MNKVLSFLDEINLKIKKYEKEIEKANMLKGIETKDEVSLNEKDYVLSVLSKHEPSPSFSELQDAIHEYILPIRNRLSSDVKNWLSKKYNVIHFQQNNNENIDNFNLKNGFFIRFFLAKPLPIRNFLYRVYNEYKIPKSVEKYIEEKFDIDVSHFEMVCYFLIYKKENEPIESLECKLSIKDNGLTQEEILKIKNNYQVFLDFVVLKNREILFYWLKEYIDLSRKIIKKKLGLVTLAFYCQQEPAMIWSLMIDGHVKVKMRKPISYKITFKGFKQNYYAFLEEFLANRKEKKYTSDFYKYLTNLENIFLFELENIKRNYCFFEEKGAKRKKFKKFFDN